MGIFKRLVAILVFVHNVARRAMFAIDLAYELFAQIIVIAFSLRSQLVP